MAGWTPGNGAGGAPHTKPMAEINITPMVDVMLVLLVIFMVTAPLLVAGVPVELPKTSAPRVSQLQKPVIVTLGADRGLYVGDERVESGAFAARLAALHGTAGDAAVYVRADRNIPYGDVMELLARLGTAGFRRISLLSQPIPRTSQPPEGRTSE